MGDNLTLYAAWEAEQEKGLSALPVCRQCGMHIQDETYYCIGEEILCKECLETNYRRYVVV